MTFSLLGHSRSVLLDNGVQISVICMMCFAISVQLQCMICVQMALFAAKAICEASPILFAYILYIHILYDKLRCIVYIYLQNKI